MACRVMTEPLEDILRVLDDAQKQGKFVRLGVSNFGPEMLEELFEIAEKHGMHCPSCLLADSRC
jgi:diketogulonate reductase-like aldo/keto reductase